MTQGLVRHYGLGHSHFVTFSCYRRSPYFAPVHARNVFETSLEAMRMRYGFTIDSYVVMPEHVHLLLGEPTSKSLSVALQALKISVARRLSPRPFWQKRFYDFNVHTEAKRIEKLQYMHCNPIKRGLVGAPEDWPWSSYRQWASGVEGVVEIESNWTARKREKAGIIAPELQFHDTNPP